jgi:hypothetical protein
MTHCVNSRLCYILQECSFLKQAVNLSVLKLSILSLPWYVSEGWKRQQMTVLHRTFGLCWPVWSWPCEWLCYLDVRKNIYRKSETSPLNLEFITSWIFPSLFHCYGYPQNSLLWLFLLVFYLSFSKPAYC